MTQHYLFPEPGSVPGIPGLFSGVRVDVANDGMFEVTPLPRHPHAELEAVEEAEAVAEEEAQKAPQKSKKSAKTAQSTEGGE